MREGAGAGVLEGRGCFYMTRWPAWSVEALVERDLLFGKEQVAGLAQGWRVLKG